MRLVIVISTLLLSCTLSFSQDVYQYYDGEKVYLRWKGIKDADITGYVVYQQVDGDWKRVAQTKRLEKNRKIRETIGAYADMYLQLAGVKTEDGDFTKSLYLQLLSNEEAYNFFGAATVMHPKMAEALGELTSFEPKKNGSNSYEIRSVKGREESTYLSVTVNSAMRNTLQALSKPEASITGDAVKITWNSESARENNGMGVYVYRSESRIGPFLKINPSGFEQMFVDDLNPEGNYTDRFLEPGTYYYYVTKFNIFGIESSPSPLVEVTLSPLNTGLISGFTAIDYLGMVELSWQTELENQEVLLYRRSQGEKEYKLLYPPSEQMKFTKKRYIDRSSESGVTYEYFALSGSYSSDTIRFNRIDTDAPMAPTNLKGDVSKRGLVTLQWDKSSSSDVIGYHVERLTGDSGSNAYRLTSSLLSNESFRDQLDVQSESAYRYRVIAVDANYNESAPSEALRLRRPDDIPPKVPGITFVNIKNGIVSLRWTPALEDDFDRYVVYRGSKSGTVSRYRETKLTEWYDTVQNAGEYRYGVAAVDQDGNESAISPTFGLKHSPEFALQPPTNLTVIDSSGNPFITWTPSTSEGVIGYLIERKQDSDNFEQLIKEHKGGTAYLDRNAKYLRKTKYWIQAYDKDWNVSEKVEVEIKK